MENIPDINLLKVFKVIIKPDMPESKIIGYDFNRKSFRIAIHAKPKENKANIELVKFLSKSLKKKVVIALGRTSREKIIRVN